MPTDLHTTRQVATRLGVSPGRVRQLVVEGRLPATKFGHALAFRPDDLRLVADRKTGRPARRQPS